MNRMSTICRECGADIEHEHCHGTVIVHIGQRSECTEADCTTPDAVHSRITATHNKPATSCIPSTRQGDNIGNADFSAAACSGLSALTGGSSLSSSQPPAVETAGGQVFRGPVSVMAPDPGVGGSTPETARR